MTSRPKLATDANFARGVGALALFVVLAGAFLLTEFDAATWYPQGASITAGIGYALFDLSGQTSLIDGGFLGAFETVDVVLVAALVAAVTLARRDDGGEA